MWIIGLALAGEGEVCAAFGETSSPVEVSGDVPDIQASGIAASRTEDGLFYTHDDAGGESRLYLFWEDGSFYGTQNIVGATNTDWEDVASGPCPASIDAEHCLWIADTGDNDDTRSSIVVWVVAESIAAAPVASKCELVYPEGKRHDAEALFVSPDGVLRIVTKTSGQAKVYRLSEPDCDGGSAQTLVEEAELDLEEPVTGAAMNPDGTEVVLRGLTLAWSWTGCTLNWSDTPAAVDLGSQPQGEAVTFANDGSLVTTSEGGDPLRFWITPCADTAPLTCPDCGCGSGAAGVLLLPLFGLARRRRDARRRS